MRSLRTRETVMLGYPIERVETYDGVGLLVETRYEVLSVDSGAVIGSRDCLRSAQNLVLTHELENATTPCRAA
ncbi:MAG TPA: hypothetical protein VF132_03475 [Rudaea sp.]